jgi:hypothetical protein
MHAMPFYHIGCTGLRVNLDCMYICAAHERKIKSYNLYIKCELDDMTKESTSVQLYDCGDGNIC